MADSSRTSGTLYGIGVGPGDPELITLKALRILRACPVVAYPAPENGDSMARAIAATHLPGGQEEIVIRMPLDAGHGPLEAAYDKAARVVAGHLDKGRDVAALCEGDPFFYGSFMYLFGRLADGHRVEVVPGVSSLVAGPAALGTALAARVEVAGDHLGGLVVGRLQGPVPGVERHANNDLLLAAGQVGCGDGPRHALAVLWRGVGDDRASLQDSQCLQGDEFGIAGPDADAVEGAGIARAVSHQRMAQSDKL